MTPIIKYLKTGAVPEDRILAKQLHLRVVRFLLLNKHKRSFFLPLLKCITPEQGQKVLPEIHNDVCENHVGGQAFVYNIVRQRYYWITLRWNTIAYAKACRECQITGPNIKLSSELKSIYSLWSFAQWGNDLIGLLPTTPGRCKNVVVVVDYFTKWVEVEPLKKIDQAPIIRFIWKSIICKLGNPQTIISYNGKQFDGLKMMDFCDKWKIKRLSIPYHPQSNG